MPAYKKLNYFQPNASNTTCDITGFKVKTTDVREQWDGTWVIHEAWSMRQPQDFPPVIIPTKTYPYARPEPDVNYPDPNPSFTVVYDSDGVGYRVTNKVAASDGKVYPVSDYVMDSEGNLWRIFKSQLEWNIV